MKKFLFLLVLVGFTNCERTVLDYPDQDTEIPIDVTMQAQSYADSALYFIIERSPEEDVKRLYIYNTKNKTIPAYALKTDKNNGLYVFLVLLGIWVGNRLALIMSS